MAAPTQQKSLSELKAQLVTARAEQERLSAQLGGPSKERDARIDAINDKFQRENSEAIAAHDAATMLASRLESELRTAIVDSYKTEVEKAKAAGVDPEKVSKQLGDGMSIRNNEKVEYEEANAVVWARENAPYLIQIGVDKKLFEAAMKQLKKTPEFVTITKVPSAVIKY